MYFIKIILNSKIAYKRIVADHVDIIVDIWTIFEISGKICRKLFDIARMNRNVLVLHGPNLNLLGIREPQIYGQRSLKEINTNLSKQAYDNQITLTCYQSNSEEKLIEAIHQAQTDKIDYIIFNPAAFTHTSIALRDALCAVAIPFIEVHLSNIYSRESFRHHSYFSDIAKGTICGFGAEGYLLALNAIIKEIREIK